MARKKAMRGKPTPPAKAKAQPKPKPKAVESPPPDKMWERIARKAYEIWEQHGYREGRDLENWLEAETIVMEEIHEARE